MKILVATSDVPFVEGGHRVLARSLVQALREAGHSAEIFTTPQNRFGRQSAAYIATWLTDVGVTGLGEDIDQVISTRFPSYALRHPNHVCWLIHRMREYYDLWPQWSGRLSWKGRIKEGIRKTMIRRADSFLLRKNVRKVFALSKTVQADLQKFGKIPSTVLYPPPAQRPYFTDGYDDYIFCPSRLNPLKRVSLLIEAIALTKAGRVLIAGEGGEKENLQKLAREKSVDQRVEFIGQVSDEKLAELYARCRAAYCAPVNEDFGMVTLEAFRSRKAVITTTDSGGPAEVVKDGVSGFVTAPAPQAIAAALTNLLDDRTAAEKMGNAGFSDTAQITWPETVKQLLATTAEAQT